MKSVTVPAPPTTAKSPLWFGDVLRVLSPSASWALLMALGVGWILLGMVRFGISDEGVDAWEEVLASVIAKVQ